MPLIIQGKTNWKFLLVVIILAVIVVGLSLWLPKILFIERPPINLSPTDEKYCKQDTDCVSEMTIKQTCINTSTYKRMGSPVQYQMLPPLLCKCINNQCIAAQDETANWKTFTNHGFEIKYPEGLQVESHELAGLCTGCADSYEFKPSNIQIIVGGSLTREAAKQNLKEGIDGISKDITVAGLSAIQRKGEATKSSFNTQFEGEEVEEVIFMKDGTLYHFFATKEEGPTLDQMLSTFRFLE